NCSQAARVFHKRTEPLNTGNTRKRKERVSPPSFRVFRVFRGSPRPFRLRLSGAVASLPVPLLQGSSFELRVSGFGFPLAALRACRSGAGRNLGFGFRISLVICLPRRSQTKAGHLAF